MRRIFRILFAGALVLSTVAACGDDSGGTGSDAGIDDATTGDSGLQGDASRFDAGADVDAGPVCEEPEFTEPPNAFFVAADAVSGGDGSVEHPLRTLEEARDAIRNLESLPEGGVTVYLREGVYERAETFELTAEDSGTEDATITYRNYPCETVQIIGGRKVSGWEELSSGPVYDRLPAEARGHVYVLDLAAQGIEDYGEMLQLRTWLDGDPHNRIDGPVPLELFIDGKPMRLARYPNLTEDGSNDWLKSAEGTSGSTLVYEGTRPSDRNWADHLDAANPIMIRSYLHFYYYACLSAVSSIDPGSNSLTVDEQCGSLLADHYYFVYNVLEELDEPGEYWLDRSSGALYFWPEDSFGPDSNLVVSLLEGPIVHADGLHDVVFRGLSFEASRGRGVFLEDCQDISFHRCRIANVGKVGLDTVKGDVQSTRILFSRGEVFATGQSAIVLSGGVRSTLTPSDNMVTDSHVHLFGRVLDGSGVRFGHSNRHGCGGTIQHSIVEDGAGLCVVTESPMTVIEHNIIRRCSKDTGDLGAVYWGYMDPASRGNRVRYNIIADTYVRTNEWTGHGSTPYSNNGIYVDGMGSGGDVSMNLVMNCDKGIHVNGGKFHHFVNNIFYRNKAVRRITCSYREPAGTYNPGVQAMIDMGIPDFLWRSGVRNWTDHFDPWTPDESWADQLSPYDTVEELEALIGNVGYRSTGYYVGNIEWENQGIYADTPYAGCPWDPDENNLKDEDPLFVDPDNGDYRIEADSPAANMDPPFPIDEWNAMIQHVGPRPDDGQ